MIARKLGALLVCIFLVAIPPVQGQEQEQQALGNVEITSTYEWAGTIVTTYRDNKVSYRFISGNRKGAFAEDLEYSSSKVAEKVYFVSFHDPDSGNHFTQVVDLVNMAEYHSSIMFYRTDRSFTNFTTGAIDEVRWLD